MKDITKIIEGYLSGNWSLTGANHPTSGEVTYRYDEFDLMNPNYQILLENMPDKKSWVREELQKIEHRCKVTIFVKPVIYGQEKTTGKSGSTKEWIVNGNFEDGTTGWMIADPSHTYRSTMWSKSPTHSLYVWWTDTGAYQAIDNCPVSYVNTFTVWVCAGFSDTIIRIYYSDATYTDVTLDGSPCYFTQVNLATHLVAGKTITGVRFMCGTYDYMIVDDLSLNAYYDEVITFNPMDDAKTAFNNMKTEVDRIVSEYMFTDFKYATLDGWNDGSSLQAGRGTKNLRMAGQENNWTSDANEPVLFISQQIISCYYFHFTGSSDSTKVPARVYSLGIGVSSASTTVSGITDATWEDEDPWVYLELVGSLAGVHQHIHPIHTKGQITFRDWASAYSAFFNTSIDGSSHKAVASDGKKWKIGYLVLTIYTSSTSSITVSFTTPRVQVVKFSNVQIDKDNQIMVKFESDGVTYS